MTDRRAAWLVAGREIRERARDRTFQTGTVVSLLVVVGVVALASVLGGGDDRFTLAVVRGDTESAEIAQAARDGLRATGTPLEIREVSTLEAARADVREDRVDAALLGAGAQVAVLDGLDGEVAQALRTAVARSALSAELARAGASEELRRAAADPPVRLAVRPLEPDDGGAAGIAFFAALLLYGQLITFGLWVAYGIAEEKGSRVVELLLSATRSLPLLTGKVLGLGVLGLVQLLLVAGVGLAAGAALDVVDVDETLAGALAATLGFFTLGYVLYAALFAVAGALVSRQEDAQSTTSPLIFALVGAFFIALQALQEPASRLAEIAALVPFSAPMVMPARLITGDAGPADALLAIVLLLATAALTLALAARVYDRAILRTGGRVPLREALTGR